jgi:hypothetical protein
MLSCFLGTQSRQLLKRLFFPLDSLYSFLGERRRRAQGVRRLSAGRQRVREQSAAESRQLPQGLLMSSAYRQSPW